jgi:F-type H+-transporting ATPase subunit a
MNNEQEMMLLLRPLRLPGLLPQQAVLVEYTWLVMILIVATLLAVIITRKVIPGPVQNMIEMITDFLEGYMKDLVGLKGMRYFPLVITLGFFILVSNYIGLIPGFLSPTSNINTTGACAIIVFISYQCVGIVTNRLKYLKHFLGPLPVLAPIMVLMEIISELARPFSLALRLFANIMGGELITRLLFGICALGIPVIWMTWESLITAPIQAFVFSLLTMIYLAGAVMADEEH